MTRACVFTLLLTCFWLLAACSPVPSPEQNQPPRIATGGLLLVEGDSWVTVPAAAHDREDQLLAFHWRQLGGPAIGLEDASQPWLRFYAPAVYERTFVRFELTVTDSQGASAQAARCVLLLPKNDLALNDGPGAGTALESETACRLQLAADQN